MCDASPFLPAAFCAGFVFVLEAGPHICIGLVFDGWFLLCIVSNYVCTYLICLDLLGTMALSRRVTFSDIRICFCTRCRKSWEGHSTFRVKFPCRHGQHIEFLPLSVFAWQFHFDSCNEMQFPSVPLYEVILPSPTSPHRANQRGMEQLLIHQSSPISKGRA
ncbi:hypothetical protein VTK26DRAFT_1153 [Humicola hyalothermophila]